MNWLEAHPNTVHFLIIVWPLLSSVVTSLFKPRTPEEYAKMPPRLAAFLKLVGSLGVDVPVLLQSLGQLVQNKSMPAPVYRAIRETVPPPAISEKEENS